jgi:hypothetical protein
MIRLGKNKKRTHVIYPCEIKKYKGFLFECFYDGAYPLEKGPIFGE